MTTLHDEVEAAELEGFYAIDRNPALVALYAGYKTQRAAAAAANRVKGKLADKILAKLDELGMTAFTIGGQPMMRKQVVEDKDVFDEKRFKQDHPGLWADYCTKLKKGTIKVWVRPQNGDDVSEDEDADDSVG